MKSRRLEEPFSPWGPCAPGGGFFCGIGVVCLQNAYSLKIAYFACCLLAHCLVLACFSKLLFLPFYLFLFIGSRCLLFVLLSSLWSCGVGSTVVGTGQKLSIRPAVGPRFALRASVRLARVMRYALLDTLAVSARFCLKTEKHSKCHFLTCLVDYRTRPQARAPLFAQHPIRAKMTLSGYSNDALRNNPIIKIR